MDPRARADLPGFLIRIGEGWMTKPYLDQAQPPNVTIAAGNLVPDLQSFSALDWRHDADNTPASAVEVQTAWVVVKSHPYLAPYGGGAFRKLTSIHATDECLRALVETHIDLFERIALAPYWDGWPDAPWQAQEALARICWAVGPHRMDVHWPSYWPKLHAAWVAKNWAACADECRIPALDTTEPGANDAEADLFIQAAIPVTPKAPACT